MHVMLDLIEVTCAILMIHAQQWHTLVCLLIVAQSSQQDKSMDHEVESWIGLPLAAGGESNKWSMHSAKDNIGLIQESYSHGFGPWKGCRLSWSVKYTRINYQTPPKGSIISRFHYNWKQQLQSLYTHRAILRDVRLPYPWSQDGMYCIPLYQGCCQPSKCHVGKLIKAKLGNGTMP